MGVVKDIGLLMKTWVVHIIAVHCTRFTIKVILSSSAVSGSIVRMSWKLRDQEKGTHH